MIKHLALLILLGFTLLRHSSDAAAQVNYGDVNIGAAPAGMLGGMTQGNSPFLAPGATVNSPYPQNGLPHDHTPGALPGAPVVVLHLPSPMKGMSGPNSTSGSQFPGSYMPQGTPLHKYNGRVVCDPPDPAAGATVGTRQRIVKTTSTRSPSAPSHPQPCPVYTINGEIQQPNNHTTTTTR